jgi:hypothetical protein
LHLVIENHHGLSKAVLNHEPFLLLAADPSQDAARRIDYLGHVDGVAHLCKGVYASAEGQVLALVVLGARVDGDVAPRALWRA